ncbi:cyclic nucleotide-binding protein, putative, partial [Bodo saltans]
AKDSVWRDMIFSRWRAGESVGDKALYFQEPHVFTLRAETNCDLVVLKRPVLLSLMDSAERSGLKQCVASGAFAVRANDPVVRLRLSSVRSIPCIEAALDDGIIQDATVRELHALFKIHVFPAGELITSSSATVKRIVVTSTGTAVVDVNSALPFTLINGTPIGCTLLANMRWRYAIYAETECEGWVLPVEDFVAFCKSRGTLKRM